MALKKHNDGRLAYGEETETDMFENGSVETNYKIHDGSYTPIKFKTYRERVKVRGEDEEFAEYLKFKKKLEGKQPLEVRFELEKTKKLDSLGFYYVWKVYKVRVDE